MAELAIAIKPSLTNPDVGDLALDDTLNEVLLTDLQSEVAQRLYVRLNFFQGEWFRDQLAGTPYYQRILRKAPSPRVVRAVFSQVILNTEGVAALLKFNYSVNRQRQMTLNFTCRLADDSVFQSTDFAPFQVTV